MLEKMLRSHFVYALKPKRGPPSKVHQCIIL